MLRPDPLVFLHREPGTVHYEPPMSSVDLAGRPHRRLNILTGEWLLISPHRANRPWEGQVERVTSEERPPYDPACYLCPGNGRVDGARNPDYKSTFVFTNDFSALLPAAGASEMNIDDLLIAQDEAGTCRVICFSPRHDLTLPELEISEIRAVVDAWKKEYEELGSQSFINYVQIFENKGEVMGCSNPHPHGQIWAEKSIPVEPAKELDRFAEYFHAKRSCLLCDYSTTEIRLKERIVCENNDFLVLVPFWAVWPFETLIVSKRHLASLTDFTETERDSFSAVIKLLTIRYDNLFEISFPYSSGIHQSPTDGKKYAELHFHMHFYPPLLRSAVIRKFMVGFEMLANPQRDITAEMAAEKLRGLPDIHYKSRSNVQSKGEKFR